MTSAEDPSVLSSEDPGPVARGPRISLWPLENQHIYPLQELLSDSEVRRFWRTRGAYWAPYQVQAQLSRDVLTSAVATLGGPEDRLVGLVELLDVSFMDARAQLSAVVGRPFLSTGIGVEMVLLFVEHAFAAYPLEKICIEVHAQNDRLAPGLHRLLAHEGRFQRHLNVQGRWHDVDVFALWRRDLAALTARLRPRPHDDTVALAGTST